MIWVILKRAKTIFLVERASTFRSRMHLNCYYSNRIGGINSCFYCVHKKSFSQPLPLSACVDTQLPNQNGRCRKSRDPFLTFNFLWQLFDFHSSR